jgi:N-acetylglucosaminyldiphosphoundecaprenol N-acetyl-beta-D-mannosaminyltransferase
MISGKCPLLALEISQIGFFEAVEAVAGLAEKKRSAYCCFANVHMLMEAEKDPEFAKVVNGATFVFPDGKPIAIMVSWLTNKTQERVAGMDFMPSLFKAASEKGLSIFLFGTTNQIISDICSKLTVELPALKIAGTLAPPFGDQTEEDNFSYVQAINRSGAHLVFVALGCPRQEKWMAKNAALINAPLLGVGGAFPVYAGITPRAPQWMQQASLEWLHRLVANPSRLWKRYLITNTLFIFKVIPLLFTKSRFKS